MDKDNQLLINELIETIKSLKDDEEIVIDSSGIYIQKREENEHRISRD